MSNSEITPSSGEGGGADEVASGGEEVGPQGDEPVCVHPPEGINDWEPLSEWLKRIADRTQREVLTWYRYAAGLLGALALMDTSWERLMTIGGILILPVLASVVLPLLLPAIAFSLISKKERTEGSNAFSSKQRAPPKRM